MRTRLGPIGVVAALALVAGAPEVRTGWIDRDPEPPDGMTISPASCGECHAALVARWRTSRHAVAATNATFTASWEHWPNGWCLTCHAPRTEEQVARLGVPAVPGRIHPLPAEPPGPAWQDGVDCATCHVRDGEILAAVAPNEAALAAHPVRIDERLRTGEVCATCHEFPIQRHTAPFGYGETPAQETWTEWRSTGSTQTCMDCHLADHTFPGSHAPAVVRDAVRVDVSRDGDDVVARVSAPDVPHRVPTGDPFRRLELRLLGADGDRVARVTLRRVFDVDETSWTLAVDRTVPPGGTRALRVTAPGAVAWQLWYAYGDPQFEPVLPADEVGFEVARGEVAP